MKDRTISVWESRSVKPDPFPFYDYRCALDVGTLGAGLGSNYWIRAPIFFAGQGWLARETRLGERVCRGCTEAGLSLGLHVDEYLKKGDVKLRAAIRMPVCRCKRSQKCAWKIHATYQTQSAVYSAGTRCVARILKPALKLEGSAYVGSAVARPWFLDGYAQQC